MVKIYADYGDEPKDEFLVLPESLRAFFYDLEMDGFVEDALFFKGQLPPQGHLLELGCGTGRITRALTTRLHPVIGIDISTAMLQAATEKNSPHCSFVCMDMTAISFNGKFDCIIIGYNTLNLLCSKKRIQACLDGCLNHLQIGGRLLLQLFVPSKDFAAKKEKTFQFQMFDTPGGGKIIKEILKQYQPATRSVHVEERFRVRPMANSKAKADYHTTYDIAGFSAAEWLEIFTEAGFTASELYGDYNGKPFEEHRSTMLLASLTRLQ